MFTLEFEVEDLELWTPCGQYVGLAPQQYTLVIDDPNDADWYVSGASFENGSQVHLAKQGHALFQILQASIRHPSNVKHVERMMEELDQARQRAIISRPTVVAHERWKQRERV